MTTTSATGCNRARRPAAFTLIELSIAVFIIAMLLAVSLPYFVRSYKASLLNSTARSLVTCCEFARLEAVLHQQKAVLHIDLDPPTQKFWISQQPRADAGGEESATLKAVEIPEQVRLVSVERPDEPAQQRGEAEVAFYPNGTCDPVTIMMRGTDKRSGLQVTVDAITGRAVPYPVKL